MVGVSKHTVLKLLVDLGKVCGEYQFDNLVNLTVKTAQADEAWSFVHCKEKNIPEGLSESSEWATFGSGLVWTQRPNSSFRGTSVCAVLTTHGPS